MKKSYYYNRINQKRIECEQDKISGKYLRDEIHRFRTKLKKEIDNNIITGKIPLTLTAKRNLRAMLLPYDVVLKTSSEIHYKLPSNIRMHHQFIKHVTRKKDMFSLVFPNLKQYEIQRIIKEGKEYNVLFSQKIMLG